MKNLTITVDDAVLEWARVQAARRGTSVSRMVGEVLADMQRREDAYARAHQSWRNESRGWDAGAPGAAFVHTTVDVATVGVVAQGSIGALPPESRS